jgi:hypothetical protein
MNDHENRARVRSRSESRSELYAVRPETALIGWSAAIQAGLADHSGPQTDHLAALVRRARRREARRRVLRLWLPRRSAPVPGIPSLGSVREAVQTGLAVALPHQGFHGDERQHHPAGRRIPDQRNRETATALVG